MIMKAVEQCICFSASHLREKERHSFYLNFAGSVVSVSSC